MSKLNNLMRVEKLKISHTAQIKIYPDGSAAVLVADMPVFRAAGWESDGAPKVRREDVENRAQRDLDNLARSMRRARARVRDIAKSNRFEWFVTLTLSPDQINRYDMAAIMKRVNIWLDNRVRRNGLAYVLVPERHKDGAIHFHGFFNGALNKGMRPSGHYDRAGHEFYNIEGWTFGFSTAMRLYGDYNAAVGYCAKYIGKQREKIGGRWYYSGGDLAAPVVQLADLDYEEALKIPGAYAFIADGVDARYVRYELEKEQYERLCVAGTICPADGRAEAQAP